MASGAEVITRKDGIAIIKEYEEANSASEKEKACINKNFGKRQIQSKNTNNSLSEEKKN